MMASALRTMHKTASLGLHYRLLMCTYTTRKSRPLYFERQRQYHCGLLYFRNQRSPLKKSRMHFSSSPKHDLKDSDTSRSETVTIADILAEKNKLRVQKLLDDEGDHLKHPFRKINEVHVYPQASVLVPFCTVKGEPSVLFTLRSSHLNDHRGEVSFPGGKMDKDDQNLIDTALRETHEELGIRAESIDVWGKMKAGIPSKAEKFLVYTVLANIGEVDVARLKLDKNEVEEAFVCPIKSLCQPENTRYTRFRISDQNRYRLPEGMRKMSGFTMPVFDGQRYRIWGLTAIILHLSLTLCCPGLYNLKIRY